VYFAEERLRRGWQVAGLRRPRGNWDTIYSDKNLEEELV